MIHDLSPVDKYLPRWFSWSAFFLCFSGRDSQKEKELYEEAKAGNLAEVKDLLQTTFVDGDENEDEEYSIEYSNTKYTPLIIAGKICWFYSFGC